MHPKNITRALKYRGRLQSSSVRLFQNFRNLDMWSHVRIAVTCFRQAAEL